MLAFVGGLVHTTRPEEFENEGIRRFPSTLNRRSLKRNNRRLICVGGKHGQGSHVTIATPSLKLRFQTSPFTRKRKAILFTLSTGQFVLIYKFNSVKLTAIRL